MPALLRERRDGGGPFARLSVVVPGEPEIDARKRPAHKHSRPYDDYIGLNHGRAFLELAQDAKSLVSQRSFAVLQISLQLFESLVS